MDNGFSYNGRHVSEFGVAFLPTRWPGSAALTANKTTISGRHGTTRYGGQIYNEKAFEGDLYLLDPDDNLMSFTDMMGRIDEITQWLQPGGRHELVLDAQPERVFVAEIEDALEFDTDSWKNGKAAIKFTLQPFKFDACKTGISYTLAANIEQTKTLHIPGTMEAPALLFLMASAAISWVQITIGAKVLRLEGLSLANGDLLAIDAQITNGEIVTVQINGTPSRGYVTGTSYFPAFLQPGNNTVKAKASGACTLSVSARGRWK